MRKPVLVIFLIGMVLSGALWAAEEAAHGEGGEHKETIWQFIGKWVNFAALVGILYFFLAKSIHVQDKFKAEADEIRSSIESARQAKEEAERQLQAMDQRMQQMSEEVTRIKTQALQDAEEEKKRILDSAQKEAQRIVEMAHREVDNEIRLARKVLRKHVADLSVQQGQKIIEQEINDDDHRRLVKTYIEEFGK
jgi:F-type H+-transporting ATPase subunit b